MASPVNIYARATRRLPLTPIERALVRFVDTLLIAGVSALIVTGAEAALSNQPLLTLVSFRQAMAIALIAAVLAALVKLFRAHGDVLAAAERRTPTQPSMPAVGAMQRSAAVTSYMVGQHNGYAGGHPGSSPSGYTGGYRGSPSGPLSNPSHPSLSGVHGVVARRPTTAAATAAATAASWPPLMPDTDPERRAALARLRDDMHPSGASAAASAPPALKLQVAHVDNADDADDDSLDDDLAHDATDDDDDTDDITDEVSADDEREALAATQHRLVAVGAGSRASSASADAWTTR